MEAERLFILSILGKLAFLLDLHLSVNMSPGLSLYRPIKSLTYVYEIQTCLKTKTS
jgi:hypothetical protein